MSFYYKLVCCVSTAAAPRCSDSAVLLQKKKRLIWLIPHHVVDGTLGIIPLSLEMSLSMHQLWRRVLGASEGWFFLTKRAHLFRRRSQWEAVLLISLGQTLACVKCLQNQHWRGPRALVDICVCSSVRIYTHAQTLLYRLTFVFVCRKTVGKSPLCEKLAVHLRLSVCPDRYQFISCLFSSWKSGEHRASVHQGEARRRDSIYLADAYPDPQKRGHQYSYPGSLAGSHGSCPLRQQGPGVTIWKVSAMLKYWHLLFLDLKKKKV